ncbi:hypothetical protein [Pseudoalteromonas rubra]|uniref:hypothetical protein n=1 Tax=Pseudoalteromonas rubra TaxID=43658 RepID=UPI002DB89908|nr:hypothetical protein [Pseudoalteromonas rubra]MEC4091146.1 hypothetical protein [Pseudoalteromonas rubra]
MTTAYAPTQMQPEGLPRQAAWGNMIDSALGTAMTYWQQVEQIKAMKNADGSGQKQQANTPELDNGAAVVVEPPKKPTAATKPAEPMLFGMSQKTVLMGAGAALVALLVLRK